MILLNPFPYRIVESLPNKPLGTGRDSVNACVLRNHAPKQAGFHASRSLFDSGDANAKQLLLCNVDANCPVQHGLGGGF